MKIITDKQSFIKAIAPIVYPGHTPRSAKNNLNKRLNRAIQRRELVLIGNQSDVNSLMFWAQCVWPTEIHNNFDIPIQATMQADFPQITSNIYAVNTPHPPVDYEELKNLYLDTHIALEKANHTIKIREASLDSALAENRSFKEKQAIIRNNCALGGKNSAGKKKEY